jgi:uncharacterized protein YqeY
MPTSVASARYGSRKPDTVDGMSELKQRLQSDLTTALKSHDEVRLATIRMTLAAITSEEVAGKQARELDDDEVLRVIAREEKKRREAAEAFDGAHRPELAGRERAEGEVLVGYLPAQLTDLQLRTMVSEAVIQCGATELRQMGLVMKIVQPQLAGRADGKRVSDEVRRQLGVERH